MNRKTIIIVLLLSVLLMTGCVKDEEYNRANCNGTIYNIQSITRWSDSNYILVLESGERIEVHPVNCYFYNEGVFDE